MSLRAKRLIKERLFKAQGGRCANPVCQRPLTLRTPLLPNSAELDHVQARSKDGDNSLSNFQLLCRECNGKKSDKDYEAFKHSYAKRVGVLYLKKA